MDGGREAPQVQRSRGRPGHTEPLCGRRRHFKELSRSCRNRSQQVVVPTSRARTWSILDWPFLHIERHIHFLCNKNKLRIHIDFIVQYCNKLFVNIVCYFFTNNM
jgi:hypothetical protein